MKLDEIELIRADTSTIGQLARQLVKAALVEQPNPSKAKELAETAAKQIYNQLLKKIDKEFELAKVKEIKVPVK